MNAFLWEKIKKMNYDRNIRQRLFIFCSIIAYAVLGALCWLLLFRMILPELSWLICFMAYPAVFAGFMGGTLYLWHHDLD
ncbi:MAG: hypothetical protein Q4D13_02360 [Erysipelotrichaceae bacterium]|nr:hypothetical protein [Erysipelotrichaceae bacterium]